MLKYFMLWTVNVPFLHDDCNFIYVVLYETSAWSNKLFSYQFREMFTIIYCCI